MQQEKFHPMIGWKESMSKVREQQTKEVWKFDV
jgi:hypothetical protein